MKVESFRVKGWSKHVTAVILSENEDWILAKHVISDYIIDGYVLYKKKYIRDRKIGAFEQQLMDVFTLRTISTDIPEGFTFGKTSEMLRWVEDTYGISMFQDGDDSSISIAKIVEIRKKKFRIDLIKSDGTLKEDYDYDFSLKKVRLIIFDSNYYNSMALLYKSKVSRLEDVSKE